MGKDPYRYFRVEGRELIEALSKGLLELERGAHGVELFTLLLRQAHTLKGAARVVRQPQISELTHALEDGLAPYREGQRPVPAPLVAEWFALLDRMTAALAALDEPAAAVALAGAPATPAQAQEPKPAAEAAMETMRIDVAEMDELLEGLSEVGVHLAAMQRSAVSLERARKLAEAWLQHARQQGGSGSGQGFERAALSAEELQAQLGHALGALNANLGQARTELGQVRERAHRLRLAPAGFMFAGLERAARDAAQALGKSVRFEASGGEVRLDAHVLASIQHAMLQLVRNAVAHGIEGAPARRAGAKPPEGRIAISVRQQGSKVLFRCEDDGAGIDVESVRAAALRSGRLKSSLADATEVIRLLLKGGISTAGRATEVSGRGVGLEVVGSTAAELKGEVDIRTVAGQGTSIELCVPITLVSVTALRVAANRRIVSLPLSAVRKSLRLNEGELEAGSAHPCVVSDGKALPYLSLWDLLGEREESQVRREARTVVVVEANGETAALGVDRLLGTSNVVLRSLPPFVRAEPWIAGAALDAEGQPELALDPQAFVTAAHAGTVRRPHAATAERPPVLVIDDSLTTRMLEQSILESAGYTVDLAISAEEGLEKARRRAYGLFVVDVEMPGMSGFEFVECVRGDAELHRIPCILVTSRASREDLQRGKDAGARAYIVKGEFDQGYLLETIRGLIG
ncbi:MAG: response regulator [Planctomycetes bacterium]|nr:response regulator [Planctomycetota bacterium]